MRGKEIEFDVVPERVATVGKPFPSIYYAIEGATDNIVGCNPSSITAYNESVLKDMYPQLENAETDWCTKDSTVNVEELLKLRRMLYSSIRRMTRKSRRWKTRDLKLWHFEVRNWTV